MKYLKISCSYSTSYLGLAVSAVGLDLSSPAHAVLPLVLVIITGWHNQPHFTLLPTMEHQASYPSPTHYYLARHWCSGARNAMNLVCGTSKVREKTDVGAWGRTQAQPGDWRRLSGCFSQIKEIREKTDFRGRERVNEREGGALDYLLVKGLDLGLNI